MDLEAVPPEDPTPAPPPAGQTPVAPWQPTPPGAGGWGTPDGPPPGAGRPAGPPPGWGAPGPGAGAPEGPPRLPRSTKIVGSAVAVAVIAGGAWAAGTALHSSGSTVRFRPAASTDSPTTGSGGSTNSNGTPAGPHHGLFRGGGGTVASVDASASSFTVTRPTRPSNGASPSTPGAAPATPSTKTVKTNGSTTYYVTETGTSADVATGMRIIAGGTVNANGSLEATSVTLIAPGAGPPGKAPNKPASGAAPSNSGAPTNTNRPFAAGTVKTVTPGSGGTVTVVVTSPRGADRTVVLTSSTKVTKTVKGAFSDVKVGDTVLARGTRNSDGSVTANVVQVITPGVIGQQPFKPGFGPRFGPGAGRGWRGFGQGGGPHPWGEPGAGQSGPSGSSGSTTAPANNAAV